jgi:microcystin degradation protein MlrC
MKRVGMLRIAQESNALSPTLSEVENFAHDREGDDLLECTSARGQEVDGFMKNAELSGFHKACVERGGVEVVPLFSVWAFPAGPLSHAALETFRRRVRDALEAAGPLDGLFLSLHGAMVGEDGTRPESVLLDDIRAIVGPDLPIGASIDLHAHITPDFLEPLTVVGAYRTNPHRDHAKTGYRVGQMLLDVVEGTLKPTIGWRHLPMVMGGGTTLDFLQPMRAVFQHMKAMERDPDVRYVSLCMCHLWLDAPDLGWATVVVTHDDQAKAERLAEELADHAWAVRFELPDPFPDPITAIEQARRARVRRRLGTVCMGDASDMVGAGAPGDNTALIRALLDHASDMRSLTAIRDTATVHELWERANGERVAVSVGGRHPGSSPALDITGRVFSRHDGPGFGKRVAVDLGPMKIVVSEKAPLVARPSFYRDLGLHPSRADITQVKVIFPFRLFFALQNRLTIYTTTEGATDFDAALRVDFDLPTHPKDMVESWRPADRRRRLGLG